MIGVQLARVKTKQLQRLCHLLQSPVVAGLVILAPLIALTAGAALLFLGGRRGGPRFRYCLAASGLAVLFALLQLAFLLRLPEGKLSWTLLALPGSFLPALDLEVDRLAAVGVLAIAALAWLDCASRPAGTAYEAGTTLAISAGAALLSAGYHTPFGLVYGWLALDAALFLGPGRSRRALLVSQCGLLMAVVALAFATAFQMPRAIPSRIPASGFSETLLLLAAALRMGLYPIWTALPMWPGGDVRALPVQRLAPAVAALGLFLNVTLRLHPGEGWTPPVLAFCWLAVLGGGLLAWLHDDRYQVQAWQTASQAGLVTLAAAFGGAMGAAMACVLALDLVLGRAVLSVIDDSPTTYRERLGRVLAGASVLGLPPTLGFAGRWLLYRQLLAADEWPSLLLIMLGSAFAAGALLTQNGRGKSAHRELPASAAVTAFVAAAATLVLGLWFRPLDVAGRALVAFSPVSALADLLYTLRSPLTFASGLALLVAILAPPAVGQALARSRPVPATLTAARFWKRLREVVELHWLGSAAASFAIALGIGMQRAAGFSSPRRAMAWTLLAVLLVTGWFVLIGFPDAGGDAVPLPSWTMLAYLSLVAVVIAVVLGTTAPPITLVALAIGQLLSALWLGWAGGQATIPLIATIYGLVGLLAVGILASSLGAVPAPTAVRSAMRRLRVRQTATATATGDGRGMALIALAVVLVLVCTAELPVPKDLIPIAALRPALLYAIGGALVVIFARTALQLVAGVLLAYSGFQLGYAQIDSGLLITFALSAFHLLFALVAAYYLAITMAIQSESSA